MTLKPRSTQAVELIKTNIFFTKLKIFLNSELPFFLNTLDQNVFFVRSALVVAAKTFL